MSDLLPACTVMLLPQHQPQQQQQLLLDPTSDEARTGGPSLTIGVTAHTGDVRQPQRDFVLLFHRCFSDVCLRCCSHPKTFQRTCMNM